MQLTKGNFYVITFSEGSDLKGFDGNELKEIKRVTEIVFYHNGNDIETNRECRLCTELEKEYWLDSMDIIDGIIPNEDFGAVSLCDFEDWKIAKGYLD